MEAFFTNFTSSWVWTTVEVFVALFILLLGIAMLTAVILYCVDRLQTSHAVRRNFPLLGRSRYFFERLGEYFRQYFFAMDREELPFNRAQRSWVYRAAKGESGMVGFGSTRDLRPAGSLIFINCPFPTLEGAAQEPSSIVFGPQARRPYETSSLYNISGMSYGAISKPAVRALSQGAAQAGIWMNTGEGGLSDHHLEGGCDIVFQIGTAKYGVRDEHSNLSDKHLRAVAEHKQVRMIEIKLSQGAKPGKGGILPGGKVTAEIAKVRGIPEGASSISPNRHTDIDSVSDILDMVARVREATGLPTGFKTVLGAWGWIDLLCKEILSRGVESAPDFITLDSGDGGTGAAPMALIDNVGMPLFESLPELVNILLRHGLKDRIKVIASGKLINPAEVAWAYCAGADAVTSARGFMFALGCIQALQCHKNTCPTGITTHNLRLQRGLDVTNKATRVATFAKRINEELGVLAHSCGVPEPRRLRRYHVRIVGTNGLSQPLNELIGEGAPAAQTPQSAKPA